jgi:tRNA-specific 2-thiouridylase
LRLRLYNPHMSRNGKAVVAMSGGVDSSVAACLLKEHGYDCIGVFMRVGAHAAEPDESCAPDPGGRPRRLKHGCCSASDAVDARVVAGRLGIPFYALNFENEFDQIIDYFVDEYAQARTPNPCVMCNIRVKFGRLLQYAEMMDAEVVATGHYARIIDVAGAPRLARARNRDKDQTYVLFGIRRHDLDRCVFPIGEIADKSTVRDIARRIGLNVHDKPDSQEICFVPDNDYRTLVQLRRPETIKSGSIVDGQGNALGTHEGIAAYTIGQRRGLGIALGSPAYVTRIDAAANTVTIGSRDELLCRRFSVEQVNWHCDPPSAPFDAHVMIRSTHTAMPARITPGEDGHADVAFEEPQLAVTPGQAAVIYDNDIVVGGGWIRQTTPGRAVS